MIKYNQRVLLLIEDTKGVLNDFPQFWNKAFIDNTYANTPNLYEMIAYNEKIVKGFFVKE